MMLNVHRNRKAYKGRGKGGRGGGGGYRGEVSIKMVLNDHRGQGFQARSKDREILEEGGGAGPSLLPRRDHE